MTIEQKVDWTLLLVGDESHLFSVLRRALYGEKAEEKLISVANNLIKPPLMGRRDDLFVETDIFTPLESMEVPLGKIEELLSSLTNEVDEVKQIPNISLLKKDFIDCKTTSIFTKEKAEQDFLSLIPKLKGYSPHFLDEQPKKIKEVIKIIPNPLQKRGMPKELENNQIF